MPPPEVLAVMAAYQAEHGLSNEDVARLAPRWYPQPTLEPVRKRLAPRDLLNNRADAFAIMEPFLGNPIFDGSLRTMDVANGCGQQCDTCFADAPLPSSLFSLDSLTRLFAEPAFLAMLQPDSLRIGSQGDIIEHPDAVPMTQMILAATEPLHAVRRLDGNRHRLKIFTNYRKRYESQLVELIQLADRCDSRLRVVISLPNNLTDTVSEQFRRFAEANRELLQWTPFRLRNPYRVLTCFAYYHPEILTQNPISPELRQAYIDYFTGEIERLGLRRWDDKPFTPTIIRRWVNSEIRFLPEYVRQQGGVQGYLAWIESMVRHDADSLRLHPGSVKNPNVGGLQDVRSVVTLYTWGRVLPDDVLRERGQLHALEAHQMIRDIDYSQRGLAKTLFNPDGLWLHIYATPEQSHTNRVYAPLTPDNVDLLTRVGFHPDFITPSNWPGGAGVLMDRATEVEAARNHYQELKQYNVVVDHRRSAAAELS